MTNEDAAHPAGAESYGPAQHYAAPQPPFVGPPSTAPRMRGRAAVVIAGVAGLLVLSGGAALGSTAYAKSELCPIVADENGSFMDATKSSDDAGAALSGLQSQLQTKARMLVFDDELQSAVRGLAGDVGQAATLRRAIAANPGAGMGDYFAELLSLFGSMNTHVREAQLACGLPATGIRTASDDTSGPLATKISAEATVGEQTEADRQAELERQEQQCQDSMDELNESYSRTYREKSDLLAQLLGDEIEPESYEGLDDSLTDELHTVMEDQTALEQSAECSQFRLDRKY
ncbi:hypothetical protein Q0Z83_037530 [Actinoplanes sichuanensis]|uniref:DUF5667 domain-containing protein n=1 Tax=Actinoplanes sichuanensis TaxID=512349 RepID=A0ABW4A2Z3_9ACTN|nr:hypothetical protein [Actinoplanes sichuanensis]BEL05562.1 hypothetical protein Q0Z83_037530 [Actinoplanes sichuanensis]